MRDNNFYGSPFVASCLFLRVTEPVPLGSLGGQSKFPKELGSFNGGVQSFGFFYLRGFELFLKVHPLSIKLLTLS